MRVCKKIGVCAVCAALCFLCACNGRGISGNLGNGPDGGALGPPDQGQVGSSVYVEQLEDELPAEVVAGDCDIQTNCRMFFTEAGVQIDGEGAVCVGNTVTVTKAGVYLLTGTLQGQLLVDTADEGEVRLILNGVRIVGEKNSAVLILSAPKRVTFFTVKDSKNIFEDAETYTDGGEIQPSACVYSKEDLTFEGAGELYVTSKTMEGICSKDDLKISGGILRVCAGDDGVKGKDSVTISGGTIGILAGKDGLKATNDEAEGKGTVLVTGGTLLINAGDDGIDAVGAITLAAGSVSVKTGGGASANDENKGNDFGGWGGGGGFRPGPRFDVIDRTVGVNQLGAVDAIDAEAVTTSSEVGGKGIKSDSEIFLTGGECSVNSYDDGFHAASGVTVSGGTALISSGDDGIHCDLNVGISGGNVRITQSYEGVEGRYITVSGGEIHVAASDDGFNATAGGSSGGMGGFRPGGGTGQDCSLRFDGGYTVVNASGDGVDSNGNIYQTDGVVIVFGPENNGNGAIDFGDGRDNGYFFEGGDLLAVGSSGMMESVTGDPAHIALRTSSIAASAGVYILGSDGSCVLAFSAPKTISSIVFASSHLEKGELSVYVCTPVGENGNEDGGNGIFSELTDGAAFFPETVPSGGKFLTKAHS